MSEKIQAYIKLTVSAGQANPAPPIGPALGQKGINIMSFCKEFNERTSSMEKGIPIPVIITVYNDKSFKFIIKTSPVSFYLKKIAKIDKGSCSTKKEPYITTLSIQDCVDIAKIKIKDMNTNDIKAATRTIIGSASSMGIEILDK